MGRDTYHHGDLRDALLGAATRLVEEEGASRVSLRAIAREAGVSAAAPYHHFEDREALLAAVAASGFEALGRAMERAAAETAEVEPLGRLRAIGAAYVRFAVENPHLFRLMFSGIVSDRSRSPELQQTSDAAWKVLEREIGGYAPASPEGGPRVVGLAVWSTVHGLAFLLIEGILDDEAEALGTEGIVQGVTKVLGRGLGPVSAIDEE